MKTLLAGLLFIGAASAQSTLFEPTNCLPSSNNTTACTINIFATDRTNKAVLTYGGITFSQDATFNVGASAKRGGIFELGTVNARAAASSSQMCSVSGTLTVCYDASGNNRIRLDNGASPYFAVSVGGSGGFDGLGAAVVAYPTGVVRAQSQIQVFGNGGTTLRAGILQTGAGGVGRLDLCETTGTYCQGFLPSTSLAANIWWTLPLVDGTSGQALTTNGAGVLSWASAGGTNYWSRSGGVLSPVTGSDNVNLPTGNLQFGGNTAIDLNRNLYVTSATITGTTTSRDIIPSASGYSIGDGGVRFTNYGVDGVIKFFNGSGAGSFSAEITSNVTSHLKVLNGGGSTVVDVDMSGAGPIGGTGYVLNTNSGYFHSSANNTPGLIVALKSGQTADAFGVQDNSLSTTYLGVNSSGNIYASSIAGAGTQCLQANNAGVISGTGSGCSGGTSLWSQGTGGIYTTTGGNKVYVGTSSDNGSGAALQTTGLGMGGNIGVNADAAYSIGGPSGRISVIEAINVILRNTAASSTLCQISSGGVNCTNGGSGGFNLTRLGIANFAGALSGTAGYVCNDAAGNIYSKVGSCP